MPRFEKTSKGKREFWEIAVHGAAAVIKEGTVGKDGECDYLFYKNAAHAKAAIDKLMAETKKRGFVQIDVPFKPKVGEAYYFEKGDQFFEIEIESKTDYATLFGPIGTDDSGGGFSGPDGMARAENEIAARIADGYKRVEKKSENQQPATAGTQRYELSDGKSNKFWQIELGAKSFVVAFGRIGTAGQTQKKMFGTANDARRAHDALVAEKIKKGYRLVNGGPAAIANKPAGKKPKTLAEAIERAKAWMKANGAKVLVDNLAKGASDSALAKVEARLGVKLPADLRTLWKLHDGQKSELDGFIRSLDLIGTRHCVQIQKDVLGAIDFMFDDDDQMDEAELRKSERNRKWIPFATRDSDHLVVHAVTGRVFAVSKDAPPLSLETASLTEFFVSYATSMEHGDYTVEKGFGDVYLA